MSKSLVVIHDQVECSYFLKYFAETIRRKKHDVCFLLPENTNAVPDEFLEVLLQYGEVFTSNAYANRWLTYAAYFQQQKFKFVNRSTLYFQLIRTIQEQPARFIFKLLLGLVFSHLSRFYHNPITKLGCDRVLFMRPDTVFALFVSPLKQSLSAIDVFARNVDSLGFKGVVGDRYTNVYVHETYSELIARQCYSFRNSNIIRLNFETTNRTDKVLVALGDSKLNKMLVQTFCKWLEEISDEVTAKVGILIHPNDHGTAFEKKIVKITERLPDAQILSNQHLSKVQASSENPNLYRNFLSQKKSSQILVQVATTFSIEHPFPFVAEFFPSEITHNKNFAKSPNSRQHAVFMYLRSSHLIATKAQLKKIFIPVATEN